MTLPTAPPVQTHVPPCKAGDRAEAGFEAYRSRPSRQPIVGNAATVLPLTTVRIVTSIRTV
jgi:hypothetical protein